MDNGKKTTPKVLTTNDIRKHARDWTLAGDVGLLAHLEQFSENIINKTQETQKNFNELIDDYEELYAKVSNITNQFLALQNCQFVENRVYDEETPTEEQPEVKVHDEAEQERLLLMQYKEAVEIGIKLLDTHFQEVQLPPNSDSDDEDEVSTGNSVIWKPKNPYANKKFPFLIGSAEWWADDHVGLRLNEEILDSEKIISESESDIESLKSIEKTMKLSSSSSTENIKPIPTNSSFIPQPSEDLFGFDKNETIKNSTAEDVSKNSNSLLEEPTNFPSDFAPEVDKMKRSDFFKEQPKEEEKREEIAPTKSKKIDNEFTRELMAKLVSVTNKTEKVDKKKEEEKTEEKTPSVKVKTGSFFDETDDSGDLFSTNISKIPEKIEKNKSMFVDAENELFKSENDLFSENNLFEGDVFGKQKTHAIADLEPRTEPKKSEKKEEVAPKNDLFDYLEDDDTLFTAKPVNNKQAKKSSSSMENANKTKPPSALDWDNEEGLFDSINIESDDDFFNSSGLFDTKVNKVEESNIVDDSKKKESKIEILPKPEIVLKPESNTKTLKTFPGSIATKTETTKKSFEDPFGFSLSKNTSLDKISILNVEEENDFFSKSFIEEQKPSLKVLTLPEDDIDEEDDSALFGEKPKLPDSVSVSSSRSSLFDDVSVSKSRLASVFDKDKTNKTEDDLGDDSLLEEDAKCGRDLFSTKEKSSLFDDCDDGDDLFGSEKNEKFIFESSSVKKVEKDIFEDKKLQGVKSFTDDLFKRSSTPMKLRVTKSDIFRKSETSKLFDDDLNDELFSDKPKPKPPSSLSLKTVEEPRGQSVKKLNIPDNLISRFESAAKHLSPGMVKLPIDEKKEEKKGASDDLIQPSALLKCPSKDRVKIPGKRRPQSRRARQEAIRNSGIWDQLTPPSGSSLNQPPNDSSPVVSNPLSPSTDEEDFFKVPELDTNFEKEDQSIFKSDLFESSKTSKLDDNFLFDAAPVLSPHSPKKPGKPAEISEKSLFGSRKPKTTSIFDDDDDDDDDDNREDDENLFKTLKTTTSDSGLKQTPKKAEEKTRKLMSSAYASQNLREKTKKSLFDADDDDDEEDLFGGRSHIIEKIPPADKPKKDSESKTKGNSSFVDPLGLMTNDE